MTVKLPEQVTEGDLSWTERYWLRNCEGYQAIGPTGGLGYVDEVRLTPDAEVDELVVRGARPVTIPAELVAQIEPRAERLRIRAPTR
jgi:hypothetical protein